MDNGQQEQEDTSSNCNNFRRDLITYAVQVERLFFIDNIQYWYDFTNQINFDKYSEYAPEELRDCFINEVLPQIYTYELNEMENNLLNLLVLHPCYTRCEHGYIKTQALEKIDFVRECKTISGIEQEYEASTTDDSSLLLPTINDLNCQIRIQPYECFRHEDIKELNKENATLLSVVLCPDEDLPACQLLSSNEMKKSLQEAKMLFECSGKQLPNVNCSIEEVIKKLQTLTELKDTIAELVNNEFKMS